MALWSTTGAPWGWGNAVGSGGAAGAFAEFIGGFESVMLEAPPVRLISFGPGKGGSLGMESWTGGGSLMARKESGLKGLT